MFNSLLFNLFVSGMHDERIWEAKMREREMGEEERERETEQLFFQQVTKIHVTWFQNKFNSFVYQ